MLAPGGDEWTLTFPVVGLGGTDSVGAGETVAFTAGLAGVVSGTVVWAAGVTFVAAGTGHSGDNRHGDKFQSN